MHLFLLNLRLEALVVIILNMQKHFCYTDIRNYFFKITEPSMHGTVYLMISLWLSVTVFKKDDEM